MWKNTPRNDTMEATAFVAQLRPLRPSTFFSSAQRAEVLHGAGDIIVEPEDDAARWLAPDGNVEVSMNHGE
jgi:hypothetical protein